MKIGWIGTGVMGASMAGHLLHAGHRLTIYTRTQSKARALIDGGAQLAKTPAEVAEAADVVCTMVGYPADVEAVYYGTPEQPGIFDALRGGATVRNLIDFTTSTPELAVRIAQTAIGYGVGSVDAPVSGGDTGARNASLAIMCGGERSAFDAVRPLLEKLGKNVSFMGGAGAGQRTKLCNQILVAGNMIGACEALLFAQRSGLDESAVIDVIGSGAAASWTINHLGPRIVDGDFAPGFYVEHFVKDMGIALEECDRLNLALPGLALVKQLYTALKAQGDGRSGTQALFLALRRLNGEN